MKTDLIFHSTLSYRIFTQPNPLLVDEWKGTLIKMIIQVMTLWTGVASIRYVHVNKKNYLFSLRYNVCFFFLRI